MTLFSCCLIEISVVLVYRLGGTSLDVTVVAVTSGMYRVLATESEPRLGGSNFDEVLMHHLATEFKR